MTTAHNKDPLLSCKEAAAYLGLNERTLYNWRSAHRYGLASIKIGRLVKYRLSELEIFIQRGADNACP